MPRYDYRCDANGRTVEVSHPMHDTITRWGQLCERAGIEPGTTPPDAPVEKVVTLPYAKAAGADIRGSGPCGPSCGCHPG